VQRKPVSKEKLEKQRSVLGRIEDLLKTRTSSKTNDKVKLMRMRQRALGNEKIAPENRYYLEVVYPIDSRVEPKLMVAVLPDERPVRLLCTTTTHP
jgi:hypothetical protein